MITVVYFVGMDKSEAIDRGPFRYQSEVSAILAANPRMTTYCVNVFLNDLMEIL